MKRFLLMLILALFLAGPLHAKGPAKAMAPWYAQLASQLKLSDEQQSQLTEAYTQQRQQTVQYKQAKKVFKTARQSEDKQALAKAKKQLTQARIERNAAKKKFNKTLNSILNDEQKIGYESMKLFMGIAYYVKPANVTTAQKTQIRKLCDQAAPQVLALTKATTKERNQIKAALLEKVFQTVLTEEQRAKARKPKVNKKVSKKTQAAKTQ